jgi:hypothetical protein
MELSSQANPGGHLEGVDTAEVVDEDVDSEMIMAIVIEIQMIGRSDERMTVPTDSGIIEAINTTKEAADAVMTEDPAAMTEIANVRRRMRMFKCINEF